LGGAFFRILGKIVGDEITSSRNPNPGFNPGDSRYLSALADRQISRRAFQRDQAAMANLYDERLRPIDGRDHRNAHRDDR
jgi:hypothetical protein